MENPSSKGIRPAWGKDTYTEMKDPGRPLALDACSELQSIFSTPFNGHRFLTRDYIRGYTKLQEGPYVHP